MKKYLLVSALAILNLCSYAQNNYDVSKISANLLNGAVAVVRNEEQFFDFKTIGSGRMNYSIAITILNKAGDDFAEMVEGYDKFSTLNNIKATMYDANGKKVKEYKSSDIKDQSLISDYSIFEDNRVKLLKFYSTTYPYTIEYSYTQDFHGILSFPSWRAIKGFGIATEKSSYTFQKPTPLKVKYLTSKQLKTDSTNLDDKIQYKWSASQIAAIVREPLSADFESSTDWVKVSPHQFQYDNTTGNFDTWKNFGAWIHQLNAMGDVLPPATKLKVQSLVKEAKTSQEKVRILYDYLQQNTRYVSVQLGIGGFKPITADKVAAVNYGDCKALSNYMKALLNEAGIKSNLIVIGNGMPGLNANYASMGQANHMILAVPFEKDTTFLECTSQYDPMGFIGYDNADRNVLMITNEGGKIIRTPNYTAKDNSQVRKTLVNLKEDGNATVSMNCSYANAQFEENLNMLLTEPVEQRKFILENLDIPGAELISFKYNQASKNIPVLTEQIDVQTNQLLTKGGEKLFLTLNIANRRESVPPKIENRKTPFMIPFSYQDEDQITYQLPKGYAVEFLPKDIQLNSDFGTYHAKFVVKDNVISYVRTQVMNAKKFPAERYNEYVDFYKKIVQADKQKAVLAKLP